MSIIDPVVYERVAGFLGAAVQSMFDSRYDWTPDAESILVLMRDEWGMTPDQERRFRPYFDVFLEQVRRGEISGFEPALKDRILEDYISSFCLEKLMASPESIEIPLELIEDSEKIKENDRALIEQLISATKLYRSSAAVHDLFKFIVRLREFAPFNAMLLHIQKPGLTHAATARDWCDRFGRVPVTGARPLLVLRMKGPVDFVFDVQDTEGRKLPEDAFAFPTYGDLTDVQFDELMWNIGRAKIDLVPLDGGDGQAGWIRPVEKPPSDTGKNVYQVAYNRNHPAPARLVTVAHELAHLYLGHLGADRNRRIPDRRNTPHDLMEVEAEMSAYLVAMRNGLKPRSESYLSGYEGAFNDLDLYSVSRTANAVERLLGI